jgi:electron transport complex protein RnfA
MNSFLLLMVFSGLSLNLIVHLGLGIENTGPLGQDEGPVPLVQTGIFFLAVPLLWAFFTYPLAPFFFGFSQYFLLFPLSALACLGFDRLFTFLSPQIASRGKAFAPKTAYNGLVLAALALTLHLASGFMEALVLSLGFSLGILFSLCALRGIQKRSRLERTPLFLRGVPLMLLSMGLLALIFSSAADLFFKALE